MLLFIPGSILEMSEAYKDDAFSAFSPFLKATGGITLSQLSKLTGLEGSTISNWIKRGWVVPTTGKRYSDKQVIRILLINMLRGAIKLEEIAELLRYINGDVENETDDILNDIPLYNLLVSIIYDIEATNKISIDPDNIRSFITKAVDNYSSIHSGEIKDEKKLCDTLEIMVLGYHITQLRNSLLSKLEIIYT
jgi:DNA-binding transcriptional MerR regulator